MKCARLLIVAGLVLAVMTVVLGAQDARAGTPGIDSGDPGSPELCPESVGFGGIAPLLLSDDGDGCEEVPPGQRCE